jgi:hypothetical protein
MGSLALYLGYVAYVGGDTFEDFRFFVPLIPMLMALTFVGIQSFGLHRAVRVLLCLLCVITMPLVSIREVAKSFLPVRKGLQLTGDAGNIKIGLLIKQNTSVTSKVADTAAGSTFYFSERYGIDLLGKNDRHIARLPTVSGSNAPGHNKFDYDYSLGTLQPDFVISNFKLPVDEEKMQKYVHGNAAFIGRLYYHPLFRARFLPNPVAADTYRTVFVSNRSSEMENRFNWHIAGEKVLANDVP